MKLINRATTSRLTPSSLWHLLLLALFCVLWPEPIDSALAETRYRIYKSTPFGFPENSLNPDAIIELDERGGRGLIYESDSFGNADIFKGPKYVIEPESLPLRELDSRFDEPCDELPDIDDDMETHRFCRYRRR